MNSLMLLAIIAGVPTLLALLLRVHSVYFFLSVAAGSLLVNHLGDDTGLALSMAFRGQNTMLIASVGLLLVPVLLTLLFLRGSTPKRKSLLHILPLVMTGLTLGVLVLPLLNSDVQAQIFANRYGDIFKDSQDVIVGVATMMALILAWLTGKPHGGKHGKHHK